jgi:hypothetical protein
MRCFQCDADHPLATGERVGFRDECASCGSDLHVCRNCAHHDPHAYNECRESSAERVGDRERANRCDYFQPGPGRGGNTGSGAAFDDLEALFKK